MSDRRFLYFAYGSNLLKQRLAARCPGIQLVSTATLAGYRLSFNQLSADGSGKGAMETDDKQQLPGVVWSLPIDEIDSLDRAESAGIAYQRQWVSVKGADEVPLEALTYRPLRLHAGAQPFDWYLALVIAGAVQAQLPKAHIAKIRQTQFIVDPNPTTTGGTQGIAALKQANMGSILLQLRAQTQEV